MAFEVTSAELMVSLVEAGLAVALLPPGVAPQRAGLVALPVVDGPQRVEYVAWDEFNPSPAARAFLGVLADGH